MVNFGQRQALDKAKLAVSLCQNKLISLLYVYLTYKHEGDINLCGQTLSKKLRKLRLNDVVNEIM